MNEEKVMTENEQKKDYLRGYKKTRNRINSLEAQKEQLRIDIQHVRASLGDSLPRAKGGTTDLSRYFEQMSEIEEQLVVKRTEQAEKQKRITDAINELDDDDECTIMTEKYINGKTWEQVAEDNGYAWVTMHRIHGRALQKIKLRME